MITKFILKKTYWYRLVLLGVFFAYAFTVFSQVNPDSLEIENLKSQLTALEKANELGVLKWQDYVGIGCLVALLSGLIGYYFKKSVDVAIVGFNKNVEEKIVKTINDKKEVIDLIIEKTDLERQLLENKKIYLWGEEDQQLVKRVLKKVGFNFSNLLIKEEEVEEKSFDLLFINNQKGSLDMNEMLAKIEALNEKQVAFYFCTQRIILKTDKLKEGKEDIVNFSTNAAQIYGNLLNSLKYQDKTKRKIT